MTNGWETSIVKHKREYIKQISPHTTMVYELTLE